MDRIECAGWITFFHNGCEIPPYRQVNYNPEEHIRCDVFPYYFIDGLEFLDCVDSGGFIGYDGIISEVLIDGYISNLGLAHRGLASGDFMVTDEIWEKIVRITR